MLRPMLCALVLPLLTLPAQAQMSDDALLERARTLFSALYAEKACTQILGEPNAGEGAELHSFTLYDHTIEDDVTVRVILVPCETYAYNTSEVFFIEDRHVGLLPLAFARPTYDYETDTDESGRESLERIEVTGSTTDIFLINSSIDPETGAITMFNKWRGIGDISDGGTWELQGGRYVLTQYFVDPTANEEMDPVTLVGDLPDMDE